MKPPHQPCAVILCDRQLLPISSGNRLRILGLFKALRQLGWRVVLVGSDRLEHVPKVRQLVDELVLVRTPPFRGGPLCRFGAEPFGMALARVSAQLAPRLVIAEYLWLAETLRWAPANAWRWLDCHDLFHERAASFIPAGLHPWVECSQEEELARLRYADLVLTSQTADASTITRLAPDIEVACLLTPVAMKGVPFAVGSERRVLAVGSDHPGNMGIVHFAEEVWPNVLEAVPNAELEVVGGICRRITKGRGVALVGHVARIEDAYRRASIVVCPIEQRSGVQTKLLEALSAGRATVITPQARVGIPLQGAPPWLEASDVASCAVPVSQLLIAPRRARRLGRAARRLAIRTSSPTVFRRSLSNLLPHAERSGALHAVPRARPPEPILQDDPAVSVIIPTHDWTPDLLRCLDSLDDQRVEGGFEVLVILNGPVTPSAHHFWPGARILYEPRPGPAAARNCGVRAALGRVFAFIDSDCRASPNWLVAALGALERGSGGVVVAGHIFRSGAHRSWISYYDSLMFLTQAHYVGKVGTCVTANMVVSRRDFLEVGPFDERFTEAAHEDWDWVRRAVAAGLRLDYCPDASIDHPCMVGLEQLRMKTERLARGEVRARRNAGVALNLPSLIAIWGSQYKRARARTGPHPIARWGVGLVGMLSGYFYWRAFRAEAKRLALQRGTRWL